MKLNKSLINQIAEAVQQAEKQTSGEIVVYMVQKSHRYRSVYWKIMVFGLLTGLLAIQSQLTLSFLHLHQSWNLTLPLFFALFLCLISFFIDPIRKLFIGDEQMLQAVSDRACRAFVSEEIFKTSERTGILIFISLFEQQVCIIGDTGINAKVKQSQWDSIIETIVSGIKKNNFSQALQKAVLDCGLLLKNSGLTLSPNDKNEISNKLRYFDE